MLPLLGGALFAALVAAGGVLSRDGDPPSRTNSASEGAPSNATITGHVHGIARYPGSAEVYVATHDGLYVFSGTSRKVGPVIDLMGFTITQEGHLLASGHPGAGADLPQPTGLIESSDQGRTWTVRSRGGQSDFHSVTQSSKGVLGYDGALRSSTDRRTWRTMPAPAEVAALAASPDGSTVLAASSAGLLTSSTFGVSWASVPGAPPLVTVDWAGAERVVGMDQAGRAFVSGDAGDTWKPATSQPVGPPQAVGASIVDGRVEILVATKEAVLISSDGGSTFTPLP